MPRQSARDVNQPWRLPPVHGPRLQGEGWSGRRLRPPLHRPRATAAVAVCVVNRSWCRCPDSGCQSRRTSVSEQEGFPSRIALTQPATRTPGTPTHDRRVSLPADRYLGLFVLCPSAAQPPLPLGLESADPCFVARCRRAWTNRSRPRFKPSPVPGQRIGYNFIILFREGGQPPSNLSHAYPFGDSGSRCPRSRNRHLRGRQRGLASRRSFGWHTFVVRAR